MRRHINDQPQYQPSNAALIHYLTIDRRSPNRLAIARMRARKGSNGPTRLAQYLRIARGYRA